MTEASERDRVRDALRQIPSLLNDDAAHRMRARHACFDLAIAIDAECFYVPVREGRLGDVEEATTILRNSDIAAAASAGVWLRHWKPEPAAGDHDIFALVKSGQAAVDGDIRLLMRHLQTVKDILAAPRRLAGGF